MQSKLGSDPAQLIAEAMYGFGPAGPGCDLLTGILRHRLKEIQGRARPVDSVVGGPQQDVCQGRGVQDRFGRFPAVIVVGRQKRLGPPSHAPAYCFAPLGKVGHPRQLFEID